jgi:cobalamin-dependent methionine synthase I
MLTGPLIGRELGGASQVIVALCTVGGALEAKATDEFDADPVRSLALYGVGSAAAEALAEAACRHFEMLAATDGLRTGVPLNPGMVGWPVLEGQTQIMALLAGENPAVTLTSSGFLVPIKSLSFVLGLGTDLSHNGCPCNYCSMRETCRHRSQHG